jgi:hypothetical protein
VRRSFGDQVVLDGADLIVRRLDLAVTLFGACSAALIF